MSTWLRFAQSELKVDERTVVIGHSTGALLAMRLAETVPLAGIVLVAAAHTDLGDAGERASGYFDAPWDWEAQKRASAPAVAAGPVGEVSQAMPDSFTSFTRATTTSSPWRRRGSWRSGWRARTQCTRSSMGAPTSSAPMRCRWSCWRL